MKIRIYIMFFIILFLLLSAGLSSALFIKGSDLHKDQNMEKRIALVIGNSNYQNAPLANPENDAKDMASALQKCGFDIIRIINADKRTMKEAADQFYTRLKRSDVGMFYYAGHGMQINGSNYLIPVNSHVVNASDVEYESVDVGRILGKMRDAGNKLNIVLLDACRDNPFERSFRTGKKGLARMEAPSGTIIGYATAPGSVAADGENRNGVFTENFLKNMMQPGVPIEIVLKETRKDVYTATNGQQTPWDSSSLMGDFCFAMGTKPPVQQSKSQTETLQITKGIAKLSDIEFNVEDKGNTRLALRTSHPVKYDFSKGSKGILYLNLYKTDIPDRHKRPLETKYFKSAVFKILPIQKAKNNINSKIEISMRERVTYHVVQNDNTIIVHFEPSSIEPPKFTEADKSETAKTIETIKRSDTDLAQEISDAQNSDKPKSVENTQPALSTSETRPAKVAASIAAVNKGLTPQEKEYNSIVGVTEYTGEKIKLDFYETDIKNIFRILSEISNKNFAIDENVTGNVTLTLDNAIPWDQVLDLILAMKQLGKIETGEVIRIATLVTLATEAKQK